MGLDDPAGIIAQFMQATVSGSYLTMTHGTHVQDQVVEAQAHAVRNLYRSTPTSVHVRSHDQVLALFQGLDLVEPGLVEVGDWHPDMTAPDEEKPADILAAIARKP